jgi:hypothetical protein
MKFFGGWSTSRKLSAEALLPGGFGIRLELRSWQPLSETYSLTR